MRPKHKLTTVRHCNSHHHDFRSTVLAQIETGCLESQCPHAESKDKHFFTS